MIASGPHRLPAANGCGAGSSLHSSTNRLHAAPGYPVPVGPSGVRPHSLDPLNARRPWGECLSEILGFTDDLAILDLHDADDVRRVPVVCEDEFADPHVAATHNAPQGETFGVGLGDARCLNVLSSADALARLGILEYCVISVDSVLPVEVVGVRGRPVLPQSRQQVVVTHGDRSSQ